MCLKTSKHIRLVYLFLSSYRLFFFFFANEVMNGGFVRYLSERDSRRRNPALSKPSSLAVFNVLFGKAQLSLGLLWPCQLY